VHEEERAPALVQPRRMALRKAHNLIMQPVGEFRLPSHWSAVSLHETSRLNGLELHQHVEVATAVPGRGPWDQGRHDDVDGRCSAEQLSGNAPLLEERHRLPIERHEAVTPKPLPFVGDHRIGEITTRLQLRQPRLHRSTRRIHTGRVRRRRSALHPAAPQWRLATGRDRRSPRPAPARWYPP